MGQGTLTGLAQLVAEELGCDWNKVAIDNVTPQRNLASKRAWGEMGTGGSRGIRISQDYVRKGGAAARMMLLQAAADQWKVPVGELTVSNGVVTHAASKRTIGYGKLAAAAAKLTPPDPKDIKLKDPKDWTIAGQPLKRGSTPPTSSTARRCSRSTSSSPACSVPRSRTRRCSAPRSSASTTPKRPRCRA